jgi:GDPmannose 4,6-dehydratase
MPKKIALITGISGQDGAYLAHYLLKKNYKVIGGDRRAASNTFWRLKKLGIINDIEIINLDVCEDTNIFNAIKNKKPDEVYNLAAQSFVGSSFDLPLVTSNSTALGAARILDSILKIDRSIRFYQASSSEMFGKVSQKFQNEGSSFYPRSPYAVAKVYAHMMTVNYREAYNMFCCNGILFNHESPLRGESFVTRKITMGLANIVKGKQNILELGNLESKRDWGFAGDYVEAMNLIINHKTPDDYVVSSGESHTVREFIERSCDYIGIDLVWRGKNENECGIDKKKNKIIIKINKKFYRPAEVDFLLGDYSKIKKVLGWRPKISFNKLVKMMIDEDLKKN